MDVGIGSMSNGKKLVILLTCVSGLVNMRERPRLATCVCACARIGGRACACMRWLITFK